MPICRNCQGTGQIEVRVPRTKLCPDCGGSKVLPDGRSCRRCDQSGEIPTGGYKVIKELCHTCWGSGRVSQQVVNIWFLLRTVPTTLLLLGGGAMVAWVSWVYLGIVLLTASLIILFLALWGGLMFHFINGLLDFGPVNPTLWFVSRAGVSSLVLLGIGSSIVWIISEFYLDVRVLSLSALFVLAVWAIFMFILILFDLPGE